MLTSEIINIRKEFKNLIQNQTEKKLEIEKKKLFLIQAIYDDILEKFNPNEPKNLERKNNNASECSQYILFHSLIITSLLKHSLSGFLFGMNLFILIPNLSHLQNIIISIMFTILDSIIFYAIEMAYLKNALNIPDHSNATIDILKTYILELKLITAIHQELASGNAATFEKNEYQAYLDCIDLFHLDMTEQLSKIKEYEESTLQYLMKNIIIFVGVISKFAGSYFIAKSLLNTFAAYLIGTPIGFIFIAIIMFGGVGTFYVLGDHSISKLMNHETDIFNQLKQEFKCFQQKTPKYQNAYRLNQQYFFPNSPANTCHTVYKPAV